MSKHKVIISIFCLLAFIANTNSEFLPKDDLRNLEFRELDRLEEKIQIPSQNSYYEVELSIGEFNEKFNLAIDLTQSDTWIHSYNCTNSKLNRILQEDVSDASVSSSSNQTENLNQNASSTCVDRNQTAVVESEEGELQGIVISEDVSMGSIIKGRNMTIISVSEEDKNKYFQGYLNADGALGLSYLSFTGPQYSFVNVLKETGSIKNKIFALGKNTFHIGDYPTEVKQFPSNYHTCNLTMNEGLPEEFMDGWICDLTHFLVGKAQDFSDAEEIQGRVIFDSMLTNIEAPEKFLGVIKAHYFELNYADNNCTVVVKDESNFIVCQTMEEEPLDFNFIIGGYALIVPGKSVFTQEKDSGYFIFNIVFTKQAHNVWRFGKLLMDQYLLVFDAELHKVGFYGDNKTNFYSEWLRWWTSGSETITSEEHMKYLIIASICLGVALISVIICLVCQGLRKKENEDEEHLEENKEMENMEVSIKEGQK